MRTWPSRPSCRADCETPVDHSRSDTSREGKQTTIFLHSARTISRIFVFEAGGLRRRKAVEIRPAPYHFGGGQIQHASLCNLFPLLLFQHPQAFALRTGL